MDGTKAEAPRPGNKSIETMKRAAVKFGAMALTTISAATVIALAVRWGVFIFNLF